MSTWLALMFDDLCKLGVRFRSMFTKVLAVVLRESDKKVLVHSMNLERYPWLRLPGGGVEGDESFEAAVRRELLEEAGIEGVEFGRKITTLRYISLMDGRPRERHCFLVRPTTSLPDAWDHTVTGDGDDADYTFSHFWVGPDETDRVDEILRTVLSPDMLPELYGG